jgi:ABC-2 type transport system permease protein
VREGREETRKGEDGQVAPDKRVVDVGTPAAEEEAAAGPDPSARSHTRTPAPATRRPYRPDHALPLRVELSRQMRRRRTQVVLALVVLLPVLLWVAFTLAPNGSSSSSVSLVDLATESGVNFAVFTLFASSSFLLVVVVALFFGDTVAAEASWSSLRYLLAAPIPRARLLRQKALVSALLSLVALLLLPIAALVVGTLAYGAGDLASPTGVSLDYGPAVTRVLAGAIYLAIHLSWVAGLALLLSVSTDAPLGAVGGAVLASIVSQILDQITALEDLRHFLPTHFDDAWAGLLSGPVDWGDMTRGTFSALTYALVFATAAVWHFHRKDITS